MKIPLSAALAISLTVAVSVVAAEKPAKKKPPTVPPTSKMIEVPPPDPVSKGNESQKLISSEMSGQDLQFFTTVIEAGRLQKYLVDLLKTKAQSEQIKALAGALSDTQEQENKQIARLSAAKGWTVSTEPTAAQKAMVTDLEKHAGPDFDKAVMDRLIAAGQESASAYEAAAQSTDKEIKSFSEQMLPLARERLQLVERMTGAGKSASQFFRTGVPPKAVPGATPKAPAAETPPAIIPPKPKPATPPVAQQAATPTRSDKTTPASTPPTAATPPSVPKSIPPPTTH